MGWITVSALPCSVFLSVDLAKGVSMVVPARYGRMHCWALELFLMLRATRGYY
jgi:hypothetical protein